MSFISTHIPVDHQCDDSSVVLWSDALPVLVLSVDYDARVVELGISSPAGEGEPAFVAVNLADELLDCVSTQNVEQLRPHREISTGTWQVSSARHGDGEIYLVDPRGEYLCVLSADDAGIDIRVHELSCRNRAGHGRLERRELMNKGVWPVLMAA